VRIDEKTSIVRQAIVLGLGSMFNHSTIRQNVGWKRNVEKQIIVYTALRDLQEGEELLISYGTRLTFVDVEAKELESDEEDPLEKIGFGLDDGDDDRVI
jgi:SET domain-containing protein